MEAFYKINDKGKSFLSSDAMIYKHENVSKEYFYG